MNFNTQYSYKTSKDIKMFFSIAYRFSDCCWKGIEGITEPKARWKAWTMVDLTKINNDGKINSSPIVMPELFFYAIHGCEHKIKIPGKI